MKRLCLIGPESTGKTMLATRLAAHFGASLMPEYGRYFDIFHKQGEDGAAKGVDWSEDDLIALAETHIAMREAMTEEAGEIMVEDTDIVQTAIWAEHLLGQRSDAIEQRLRRAELADHYLVLSPDVGWVDDGVRYAGDADIRRWFFEEALLRVNELNVSFDVINGADWDARTARAIRAADAAFRLATDQS